MASKAVALNAAGTAASTGGSRSARNTATLELYDAKPAAGGAKLASSRGQIEFQFNPKELSIQKSARWERKPARNAKKASPPEFSGADPCKLTLEMFFDASDTEHGSVVNAVEELFHCCVPTDDTQQNRKATPPLVQLKWGAIVSFPAFITSVQAKYTLFLAGRYPDPGDVQRLDGGDARRPGFPEPDVGRAVRARGAQGDLWRLARFDRVPGVRGPVDVAAARPGQQYRRPHPVAGRRDADRTGGTRAADGRVRGPTWPASRSAAGSSSRSTAAPLPSDVEQLLVEAYVDDSRNLPDLFVLRFRDANRVVLSKAAVKIGSRIKVAVTSTGTQTPVATDIRRGHRGGGGLRRDRHVHVGPRVRPVPSAVPWSPRGDLYARSPRPMSP